MQTQIARAMFQVYEPIVLTGSGAPEVQAIFKDLGLSEHRMSYYAVRSAALGPVAAEVVSATFYHHPVEMVSPAIPLAWSIASPERIVAARFEAVDQARLKFLLGDRSKEGSEFHRRTSVLGPIARSEPVYVGQPDQAWLSNVGGSAYASFMQRISGRRAMVYAGSNSGALHGFDAVTGEEKLAYYPAALFSTGHGGYHDLSQAGFTHTSKYVDGVSHVSDVEIKGQWRTVLVGSLGGGGRGLFALDVTDPGDLSNASKTVLWEFTHKDDPHLGYTHSKPVLVRLTNGKWAAIVGNGQGADASDATAGQAQLFIIYLDGPGSNGVWDLGRDYLRIATGVGTDQDRNALFAPIAIDAHWSGGQPDGKADVVYAGDEYGNLWRFDLHEANASQWSRPTAPLFRGDRSRPITALPAVTIAPAAVTNAVGGGVSSGSGSGRPSRSVMVFFGTGRFLADANKSGATVNRFYGIYDDGRRDDLTESNLTAQVSVSVPDPNARIYKNDLDVGYASGKRGWLIALPDAGERVIDRALVRNGLVHFNTIVPGTAMCDAGGKGWEMVVMLSNGGSAAGAQWDYNQDGSLNLADTRSGLSYAGRRLIGKGMPGAPKVIGNQLYTPLVDKVGKANKGPRDHFQNTKVASSSGPGGRLSWQQLYRE